MMRTTKVPWFRIDNNQATLEGRRTENGGLEILIYTASAPTGMKLDRACVDKLRDWLDKIYPTWSGGSNVIEFPKSLPVRNTSGYPESSPPDPAG